MWTASDSVDCVVSTYTLGAIPFATRTMAVKEISRYALDTPPTASAPALEPSCLHPHTANAHDAFPR